ncbi:MAG TPA: hypothetical protein PLW86_16735 [Rhodocyclaceae bacterium]|nr:hypothetical protein [Rhodocyclaceae bacterium]
MRRQLLITIRFVVNHSANVNCKRFGDGTSGSILNGCTTRSFAYHHCQVAGDKGINPQLMRDKELCLLSSSNCERQVDQSSMDARQEALSLIIARLRATNGSIVNGCTTTGFVSHHLQIAAVKGSVGEIWAPEPPAASLSPWQVLLIERTRNWPDASERAPPA